MVWGEPELSEADDNETVVDYTCQTSKVMDRLNIMGFTMDRVRTEFEQCRLEELEVNGVEVASDEDEKHIAFLCELTFDGYAEAFGRILRCGYLSYPFEEYKSLSLDPIVTYILDHQDKYPFGFFCADIRCLIRLACELSEPESLVVQDISELVSGGYYEESEPVCEDCLRALIAGHPENAPRIILTEGSSDRSALEAAMTFLYPHLSQYYSFLDFESTRSPGGAPHLVAMVKAFAAAGITNRLIALFDNDTAAQDARRALNQVSLPNNIAVLNYPDLPSLEKYPTIEVAQLVKTTNPEI